MYQTYAANPLYDFVRTIFSFVDSVVYWLLSIIYQIFFNVAGANILDGKTVFNLFGRIQLILGVFMLFQLGMTIIRGLVDPDSFTDSKKGVGNLITRIITAMVLFACIVPIRMPNGGNNEYERSINNNGLLFGTLYSLQHRILASNTIGKIILGDDSELTTNMNSSNSKSNNEALAESSREFTVGIFRSFFRINLVPEENRKKHEEGKPDEYFAENRLCGDNIDDQLEVYEASDVEVQDLLDLVNEKCKPVDAEWWKPRWLPGVKRYVFAYNGLTSCLVSIFILVMLVSFTIDVAVRSIKLALLRLLAPIPIISYMNPNGKGDEAMKSWTGLVTSTYLDLFMRLALIMFVIFIAQNIIDGGISLGINGDGPIGIMSIIFIILGLFMFAKKAPKFIYDVLGIKGEPGGLFSGLGAITTGLGFGAAAFGSIGSFAAGRRASIAADEANGVDRNGMNLVQKTLNTGKHIAAGIGGGFGGLAAGVGAATAKDGSYKKVLSTLSKRNSDIVARGQSGSTAFGRAKSAAHTLFTGESKSSELTRDMKNLENKSKANSSIVDFAEKKVAASASWTTGKASWTDSSGTTIDVKGNYADWTKARNAAKAANKSSFVFDGKTISTLQAEHLDNDLKESNAADFIFNRGVNPNAQNAKPNVEFETLVSDYDALYGQGSFGDTISNKSYGETGKEVRSVFNDEAKKLSAEAANAKRSSGIQEANDFYSTKK